MGTLTADTLNRAQRGMLMRVSYRTSQGVGVPVNPVVPSAATIVEQLINGGLLRCSQVWSEHTNDWVPTVVLTHEGAAVCNQIAAGLPAKTGAAGMAAKTGA